MDIHILCGGNSTEHDISLRSARSIINNLDKNKYNVSFTYITRDGKFVPIGAFDKEIEKEDDLRRECNTSVQESVKDFLTFVSKLNDPLVIPVIHGTTGEDGQIQGFLQTLGLKYVGSGVSASAICFDKALANDIMEVHGLPQAKYYALDKYTYQSLYNKEKLSQEILDKLGENVYVKPSNNGSSIGVSKADRSNLIEAIEEAFKFDDKVLIEEEMIGVELEISVVGNALPKASLAGSYSTQRDLFDYTAKYLDKNLVRNLPHDLPKEASDRVRQLAIDAYLATGCHGFARVDIFMDKDFNFFINEINTFPGMTPTSLSASLWEVTNSTTYSEFLDIIINYAVERYQNA